MEIAYISAKAWRLSKKMPLLMFPWILCDIWSSQIVCRTAAHSFDMPSYKDTFLQLCHRKWIYLQFKTSPALTVPSCWERLIKYGLCISFGINISILFKYFNIFKQKLIKWAWWAWWVPSILSVSVHFFIQFFFSAGLHIISVRFSKVPHEIR